MPARRGRAGSEPTHEKPLRSALECMHHDARSAAHALNGFVELLETEVLGPLTEEQRRALRHVHTAAERLSEITEGALELIDAERPRRPAPGAHTCLAHVTQHALYAVSRAAPETSLTFAAADGLAVLHVDMEHEALRKLLQILLEVALSTRPTRIDVRLSQTDLHASLVLGACHDDSSLPRVVPIQSAASTELDSMAGAWSNRDYVRLKRCETLLTRRKGRLLVTPDFARIRVMLPLSSR